MSLTRKLITCEICQERTSRINNVKRRFMAKFPLDEERCRKWVKVVGNIDLVYLPIEKLHKLKYVCGKHFTKNDFNKKHNRLKRTAVPSRYLQATSLPEELFHEFPFHIHNLNHNTMINIPRALPGNEDIVPHIEPIAGPSISEINTPASQNPEPNLLTTHTTIIKGNHASSSETNTYMQKSEQELVTTQTTVKKGNHSSSSDSSLENHLRDHNYAKNKVHKMIKISDTDHEVTPRKKKLLKKVRYFKRKIHILQEGNVIPRIKSLALRTLIKAYLRNISRKPQGNRWTHLEKALAIAIYKKSPRTYRHLSHLLSLPSIRTLQTMIQSINLEPGISPTILEYLKKWASNSNVKDRYCALLFDEIALKKRLIFNPKTDQVEGFVDLGRNQYRSADIANHALVFMIQGLHKKLKQPIAYYFVKGTVSSQTLAVLIKNIIKAVTEIGFTVVNTVCDQGPTNIGSLNYLKDWCGIPKTCNYFLLGELKIYIMFDIPHLFKSIRNNFHSGGVITIDGKKGKWSHLLDVAEKNNSTLHFKKLSHIHVNPTFRAKMKVKLAAQVLSNTVAAILKLMAEKYDNDLKAKEILETAQIVEDLDRLFDCTNGPASNKDIIRGRRENVSKKTKHVELWKYYKEKLSKMYFTKSDSFLKLKNVRCVQGFITSLSSLEDIWRFVESKGFKYLNLRQLNQDSLENLFGMIRQHCPTNRNPTCHHFTAGLKSNILTKLSTPVGRGANCEEDKNEVIIDFEDFLSSTINNPAEKKSKQSVQSVQASTAAITNIPDEDDAHILQMENNMFEEFEKQPTVYVAGYLAAVTLKKMQWQCTSCVSSLKIENPELCDKPIYAYIRLREWWQNKKSLTYPSESLCKLVDTSTKCFEVDIKPILHERNISEKAIAIMMTKCVDLLRMCNDHKNKLIQILLLRLSHLLIRNQCHLMNLTFAKSEEATADIIKKAQQQGTAK